MLQLGQKASGSFKWTLLCIGLALLLSGAAQADTAWQADFVGTPGVKPTGWRDNTTDPGWGASLVYANATSFAQMERKSDNTWGKAYSPQQVVNVSTYSYIEVGISNIDPGTTWKLAVLKGPPYAAYQIFYLNASSNSTGIFTFDYQAATGWTGAQTFEIQLTIEGAVGKKMIVDYVLLRSAFAGPTPTPTPVRSTLMDLATPVVLGHFMVSYANPRSAGANTYRGWSQNNPYHDPNTVTGGKRDIAAIYYPQYPDPNPAATPAYKLEGPYDMPDPDLVERHANQLLAGHMDGASFDVTSYKTILPSGQLDTTNAWQVGVVSGYLQDFQNNNAIPANPKLWTVMVYEDKVQWLWVTHPDRASTVAAAQLDLTNWLNLAMTTYAGTNYEINGRPVLYLFSYEGSSSRGVTRLSAEELKTWKESWASGHGGIAPVLVTNVRQTAYPYGVANALESASTKYIDVYDGFFEWPQIVGAPSGVYTGGYNTFAIEKNYWANKDANTRYRVQAQDWKIVVSGVWAGFDDWGVMNWGAGTRRGIPRTEGTEYLYDYQFGRALSNAYPVIQVATWNDWFEGSNIEPSVDFGTPGATYASSQPVGSLATNGNERAYEYLDLTEKWSALHKGVARNNAKYHLPDYIYLVRKRFASDPTAMLAANAATLDFRQGNYAAAISAIQPYIYELNVTPTVTLTATVTVSATVTPTATKELYTRTPTPFTISALSAGKEKVIVYPNPSHGDVKFGYMASGTVDVQIDVFNVTGETITTINETKYAGFGQTLITTWQAGGVAPGIYLARVQVKDENDRTLIDLVKKIAIK